MPHRQGKWERPFLKIEIRPDKRKGRGFVVQCFGKTREEYKRRLVVAVESALVGITSELEIEAKVAGANLPFDSRVRPWLSKAIGRLFG